MAQRRMFSTRVVESTRFLKMPLTTQALYFHLGIHADDDGVVEAYNVIRVCGCSEDDLRVLAAKGFVKVLNEDLITYITDWGENNHIRADRKIDSIYKDLIIQMVPEAKLLEKRDRADKKSLKADEQPEAEVVDNQWTSNGQPMDNQLPTNGRHRLGKDRLGKDRIGKVSIENTFEQLWSIYPRKQGKKAAFDAYKRAIKDGATDAEIQSGIEAYIVYIRESGTEPQYIKQGSTFFNQRAWADDWTPRRKKDVYTQRMEAMENWGKQYES